MTVSAAKVPTRRKKGLAVLNTNLTTQVGASTDGQQPPRRRSARLSGGSDSVQPTTSNGDAQVENAKRRKLPKHQQMQPEKQPQLQEQQSRHISSPLPDRTQNAKASPPATIPAPVTIGPLISTPNEIHVVKKRIATKIALPFADTPVIQRNKDMRKNSGQGHRRSSGGMRGRRASSLIEENKSNGMLLIILFAGPICNPIPFMEKIYSITSFLFAYHLSCGNYLQKEEIRANSSDTLSCPPCRS